jgi:hypothetical protein
VIFRFPHLVPGPLPLEFPWDAFNKALAWHCNTPCPCLWAETIGDTIGV